MEDLSKIPVPSEQPDDIISKDGSIRWAIQAGTNQDEIDMQRLGKKQQLSVSDEVPTPYLS